MRRRGCTSCLPYSEARRERSSGAFGQLNTPQRTDIAKVKEFEGFPQYVCRLDINAAGFRSLRKTQFDCSLPGSIMFALWFS